jgi:hypothetical protein
VNPAARWTDDPMAFQEIEHIKDRFSRDLACGLRLTSVFCSHSRHVHDNE